jgi:hypothetical protein
VEGLTVGSHRGKAGIKEVETIGVEEGDVPQELGVKLFERCLRQSIVPLCLRIGQAQTTYLDRRKCEGGDELM